jgi:hypothetical protein
VLKYVKPYFSPVDIEKGERWDVNLGEELKASNFCITVLTRQNLHSKWMIFEGGAISKGDQGRVCPVLFGIEPADVKGPLATFQAATFSKDDIYKLLKDINSKAAKDEAIPQAILDQVFDDWWPDLERDVSKIMMEHPSSEELDQLVSKISDFSGTKYDVAGSGKTDRDLEYFLEIVEPALSKAGWVHVDWDVLGEETFQMPFSSSKFRYGIVTGVAGVEVLAAMHGDKNDEAQALVNALNEIGIPATKRYAQAKHDFNVVPILVGPMR